MRGSSDSLLRGLIRLSYLLPSITLVALIVHFAIPHIFFLYNGEVYETMNSFTLMGNTWSECRTMTDTATEGSTEALYFSYVMSFFVILSWVAIVLFAVLAITSAVCSLRAFAHVPTDREANRAKRWMQFFCPNRVLYVLTCMLLLIPASFALILEACYRKFFLYEIEVLFIGPSEYLTVAIGVVLCVGAFLALLPAQSRLHMDMYRLYKAKKDTKEH